jgi:hypothetical protein
MSAVNLQKWVQQKQQAQSEIRALLRDGGQLAENKQLALRVWREIVSESRWQAAIDYFLDEELPHSRTVFDGAFQSSIASFLTRTVPVLPSLSLVNLVLGFAGLLPTPGSPAWPSAHLWTAYRLAPPERDWRCKSVTRANNICIWLAQLRVWPYLVHHRERLFQTVEERQHTPKRPHRKCKFERRLGGKRT